MRNTRYKVRVTKDSLVFSSGHFITFNGDHCERIHGHNYRVAVEVEGAWTRTRIFLTSSPCATRPRPS